MSDECVLVDIEDRVATITLNRGERHNAFDDVVILRLSEILDDLARNDALSVVILRGKGKSFSAGADLGWMKRAASFTAEQNKADALALSAMLYKLYTLPQVTISYVHGVAMGGGMGLVSCCDIVIADKDTKFALSEVRLGLIPATIGPYVLRAIGERQARRYFQTGERFDGQKAYDIGLVHELAERPEDTEYLLHKVLKQVIANGPKAMRASKMLCADLAGQALSDDLLTETAQRIATIRTGDEAKEGIESFFDKRSPSWVK